MKRVNINLLYLLYVRWCEILQFVFCHILKIIIIIIKGIIFQVRPTEKTKTSDQAQSLADQSSIRWHDVKKKFFCSFFKRI